MNRLDGKAEYVAEGDIVLCSFFVFDDADSRYHPERIKVGTFRLLARDNATRFQRNFDYRFANGDGQFHFDIAHPSVNQGMLLDVTCTLHDDSVLSMRVPVRVNNQDNAPTTPPMAVQPQVGDYSYGITKG